MLPLLQHYYIIFSYNGISFFDAFSLFKIETFKIEKNQKHKENEKSQEKKRMMTSSSSIVSEKPYQYFGAFTD